MNTSKKGFTLIEILVVIGIVAILAAVVLLAINPARQFAQARNSQRASNVNALLNAFGQNLADNKGLSTCGTIPPTPTNIGTGAGLVDLSGCLVPTYLSAMLMDPDGGTAADTKYKISKDTNNRITVEAVAELGTTISVTR